MSSQPPFPELAWNEYFPFPSPHKASQDGFLASGGNLSPGMLLSAYRQGIFPWYDPSDIPLWWSPDPRCVVYPEKLHVSSSMRKILHQGTFQVTFDQDFESVIHSCQSIFRPAQAGTWIGDEIVKGYGALHQMGYVHSVEVWQNDELVGGLYGVHLGKVFFGESMFSKVSNASKAGFLTLVPYLVQKHGIRLIDCQVRTNHLESLGAEGIPRKLFLSHLKDWVEFPGQPGLWK